MDAACLSTNYDGSVTNTNKIKKNDAVLTVHSRSHVGCAVGVVASFDAAFCCLVLVAVFTRELFGATN